MHTDMYANQVIRLRTCSVDVLTGKVTGNRPTEDLTEVERSLLEYFVGRAGEPIRREEAYQSVWGHDGANSRVLDVIVSRLRRKLEEHADRPDHLVTVFGVGYRFEALAAAGATPIFSVQNPPTATDFNRFDELSLLGSWFAEGRRLVNVHGPSGSGKSELSRRFAGFHSNREARCSVSLLGCRTPAAVARRVAEALRVSPFAADGGIGAVSAMLRRQGRYLLILEDAQEAIKILGPILERWMVDAPSLDVLAISHEALPMAAGHRMALAARAGSVRGNVVRPQMPQAYGRMSARAV